PALLQNQTMDFAVQLNGNGNTSPFFSSLEWDSINDNTQNPFVAVGVAAMGIAGAIALYNMYRRRGRPMMILPGVI
ncbi:MAG: hypothetical protein Q8L34_00965, partial [Candidatus Woesearchaeota archaeon]|nr:hypothetical protein [Candidatus Woesearchaeota archaeon]